MADSEKPNVTMETGPVICGRCRREITPLVIDNIQNMTELRVGSSLLIHSVQAACLHCGWEFTWYGDKKIEKKTLAYRELLEQLKTYNPE